MIYLYYMNIQFMKMSLDEEVIYCNRKNASSVATFLHVFRCTIEKFISF